MTGLDGFLPPGHGPKGAAPGLLLGHLMTAGHRSCMLRSCVYCSIMYSPEASSAPTIGATPGTQA